MNDATLSDDEKKQHLILLKKETVQRLKLIEENQFKLRESNEVIDFKFGPESVDGDQKVFEHDAARFGPDWSKEGTHLKEVPASSGTLKKIKPGQN